MQLHIFKRMVSIKIKATIGNDVEKGNTYIALIRI